MSHPDNELRRTLWRLADKWEKVGGYNHRACAADLREALTYPGVTEADEAELVQRFGKTSEELADEAEKCTCERVKGDDPACHWHSRNWPVEPPLSPADRSFDERGMGL